MSNANIENRKKRPLLILSRLVGVGIVDAVASRFQLIFLVIATVIISALVR